ncbi:MAG TPA: proton-conducting transporter membrane subunit [Micromonosporaceae bacterium]
MNHLLLIVPILLPLLAAAGHAIWWRTSGAFHAGTLLAALTLADAVALAVAVSRTGPVSMLGGLLRADALTAWMLLVVAAVGLLACWASPSYLVAAHEGARRSRWYGILLQSFLATMIIAVLAGNLGVLWVAVEATTIVTAFLVGHHRTKTALEAAWKYVVICSAAIAIAFLGVVLLSYAVRHAGLVGTGALDWASLTAHASDLDPAVTRIAIGLAVLGFGAKAGLVPLHAWLPDAHSQAPAPVSGLMSGVLLSVAFYAVLRLKVIADVALGPAFLRTLLLILALATLALAALLLLGQRDYKRMLAYSSMEHMGLIALGAGVGSQLAVAAVLLHVAGHGLAKTTAFLGSGHILHRHGSTEISAVRGLGAQAPLLAFTFGVAVLALLGFPPAAVFASEVGLARAGAAAGLGWAIAAGYLLALVAFVAIAARTGRMLLGNPADPDADGPAPARFTTGAAAPLLAGLAAVTVLGVTTGPLSTLLTTAASIVGAP